MLMLIANYCRRYVFNRWHWHFQWILWIFSMNFCCFYYAHFCSSPVNCNDHHLFDCPIAIQIVASRTTITTIAACAQSTLIRWTFDRIDQKPHSFSMDFTLVILQLQLQLSIAFAFHSVPLECNKNTILIGEMRQVCVFLSLVFIFIL